ncbi:hypothetical protein [Streptomyces virginiae]|uniref:hypothetical protein n=1 Tax=Streptomyces virginiae TaxID=1961 RepID=UPI00224C8937|nr:hypothetical protein [Streptomyces virginiae]MCX5274846.1 hypothetical protein [Streptomyces virginiae]
MTTTALAGPGRIRTRATTERAAASLPRDFAPGTAAAPARYRPAGPEGHRTTGEGA